MIQWRVIRAITPTLAVIAVTVVTITSTQAQTTSVKPCSAGRFFVTGESGRQHLALSPLSLASMSASSTSPTTTTPTLPFDTCDYFYKACDRKAGDLRESCEFRDEGGGGGSWGYTSCNCQGLREYKRCMEDNGCANHPSQQFDLEQHPECFGIQ